MKHHKESQFKRFKPNEEEENNEAESNSSINAKKHVVVFNNDQENKDEQDSKEDILLDHEILGPIRANLPKPPTLQGFH